MLENYGFKVVDLGKDIPASCILAAAQQLQAAIIGLSALMTTPCRAWPRSSRRG